MPLYSFIEAANTKTSGATLQRGQFSAESSSAGFATKGLFKISSSLLTLRWVGGLKKMIKTQLRHNSSCGEILWGLVWGPMEREE